MADEMRAVTEQLGDQRRLGREVPAGQRRAAGEPRPVRHDQRPALGERELVAPRAAGVDDAAVHEHDARAGAEPQDVEVGRFQQSSELTSSAAAACAASVCRSESSGRSPGERAGSSTSRTPMTRPRWRTGTTAIASGSEPSSAAI